MANLEDYLTGGLNLGELAPDDQQRKPISNLESNRNMAAYVAVNSDNPQEVESVYRAAASDLDESGDSEAVKSMLSMARGKSSAKARKALVDYVSDPEVGDEDKVNATQRLWEAESEAYKIRDMTTYEALESDSGDSENDEEEFVRTSVAEAVEEVNQYKKDMQYVINSELSRGTSNYSEAWADTFQYFTPFVESKYVGQILDGIREGDESSYLQSFTMLGNAKMDIRDMVKGMPLEDRLGFAESLSNLLASSEGILNVDENDFAKQDLLATFLQDGYYDDVDKWIDNVVGWLDASIIGGPIARTGVRAARMRGITTDTIYNKMSDVKKNVTSRVMPTSVSQNVKDANPEMARNFHDLAAADPTDEVAKATYGGTRADAVMNDLAAEAARTDGKVSAKVGYIDKREDLRDVRPSDIWGYTQKDGMLSYFDEEKVKMRSRVVNDFAQAYGMRPRKEMFQTKDLGEGVAIRAVYGPTTSGYSDPEQALSMAEWAFREYGVTRDQMTLLVRQGSEYVPTTMKQVKGREELLKVARESSKVGEAARVILGKEMKRQPDYLVQVEHKYKFDPNDVTQWMEMDIKNNWADRLIPFMRGGEKGSFQQMMLDPASYLHPKMTLAGNVVIDRAAELERKFLTLGDKFASRFSALPQDRQLVLEQMIKQANHDGFEYSATKMAANGFSENEIQTLKSWREFWDTAYFVENADAARTLRSQGFRELVDPESDTRLFAKEIKQRAVGNKAAVYDQRTDTIRFAGKDELDELYANNGTLARLKRPIQVGEDEADLVVVANKHNDSYLRRINDDTTVLNYRKGYYGVQYVDPKFIDKVMYKVDANGKRVEKSRKAVATAGSIKDAKTKAAALKRIDHDEMIEYQHRSNIKQTTMDFEDYWDLQQAKGRTAQRVRGQRLEDSTSNMEDLSHAPIMDPVDSMISSARSISRRASMRDMLEVSKHRFMDQFEEFLPINPKTKQPMFPSNVDDLKWQGKGSENHRKLADARTTFNHIYMLENSFINAIDETYKAFLRRMADAAGEKGGVKIEKALRKTSELRGPSAALRGTAFTAYLALNPLRQIIIQSHQSVQLAANFPDWIASQRAAPELMAVVFHQLGMKPPKSVLKSLGMSEADARKLFIDWRDSGLSASVDKQNLIRGGMADLADRVSKKDWKPVTALRKVGFDAGENFNMMTAWLAHRHRAVKEGRDITDNAVLNEIAGEARNYTYNMNAAGEMAYNQNYLSMLFQFFQVPHKALMTMTTNRVLTGKEKARLAAFNAMFYSMPTAAMFTIFGDIIPEEEGFARDAIVNGLEGAMINKVLSLTTGEDTYVDFSDLAPLDMHGQYEFIHSLFTLDIGTLVSESPGGQLFSQSGRITDLAKTASSYFHGKIADIEDPTEFREVARSFAEISSGMSNAFKARAALEFGKKTSTGGDTTDSSVTTAEAIAALFGFSTMDEAQKYWISDELYTKSKAFRDDFDRWYDDYKQALHRRGMKVGEQEWLVKVHSTAFDVWGNDNQRARDLLDQKLRRDLADGNMEFYKRALRSHDIMSRSENINVIKAIPDISEERRQRAIDALNDIYDYKEQN